MYLSKSNEAKSNEVKHVLCSSAVFSVMTALSIMSFNSLAASQCKGLTEVDCATKEATCDWVDSYKRSDGKTVKSYCRTETTKKKSASKTVSKVDS